MAKWKKHGSVADLPTALNEPHSAVHSLDNVVIAADASKRICRFDVLPSTPLLAAPGHIPFNGDGGRQSAGVEVQALSDRLSLRRPGRVQSLLSSARATNRKTSDFLSALTATVPAIFSWSKPTKALGLLMFRITEQAYHMLRGHLFGRACYRQVIERRLAKLNHFGHTGRSST